MHCIPVKVGLVELVFTSSGQQIISVRSLPPESRLDGKPEVDITQRHLCVEFFLISGLKIIPAIANHDIVQNRYTFLVTKEQAHSRLTITQI